MGTSSPFGGTSPQSQLYPSWLEPDTTPDIPPNPNLTPQEQEQPKPPPQRATPKEGNRFGSAKSNYTRYANSGGTDRRALNRALSSYVKSGSGGSSIATIRMGASRSVAANTAKLFADIYEKSVEQALFDRGITYSNDNHAGDVLIELLNKMDFNGGPIDEAIARDAMIASIAANIDNLDVPFNQLDDAVYPILIENFITKSIVDRIVMDIGQKGLYVAKNAEAANYIQEQLENVVAGAVSDSFASKGGIESIVQSDLVPIINQIYTDSFIYLEALGEDL